MSHSNLPPITITKEWRPTDAEKLSGKWKEVVHGWRTVWIPVDRPIALTPRPGLDELKEWPSSS